MDKLKRNIALKSFDIMANEITAYFSSSKNVSQSTINAPMSCDLHPIPSLTDQSKLAASHNTSNQLLSDQ